MPDARASGDPTNLTATIRGEVLNIDVEASAKRVIEPGGISQR